MDTFGQEIFTQVVLHSLEKETNVQLKYFTLSKQGERKIYFCIGKHSLFLVDNDFKQKPEEIPYSKLKHVVVDMDDFTTFKIVAEHTEVVLEAIARQQLLSELQVYYKTDTMLRQWKVCDFPLKSGSHLINSFDTLSEFTSPPPGFKRFTGNGYMFWMKTTYKDQGDGKYLATDSPAYISIQFEDPQPVSSLDSLELERNQIICESLGRELAQIDGEYYLLRSERYLKHMNLTSDQASWTCWMVYIRSSVQDIGVMLCRRKFLPPFGDKYQDIHITLCGGKIHVNPEGLLEDLYVVGNSLAPEMQLFLLDERLVQARANALLYDADSYTYFSDNFNIAPNLEKLGRQFCKSIVQMLEDDGIQGFNGRTFDPAVETVDDPFGIIEDIESTDMANFKGWKQNVANYLGFCIDDGLYPGELGLSDIVNGAQSNMILRRLLDYVIHMTPEGEEYTSVSFAEKVASIQSKQQSFTCNERLMAKLMKLRYVHLMLDKSIARYMEFLLFMLQMSTSPVLIQTACLQLAALCQASEKHRTRFADQGGVKTLINHIKAESELTGPSVISALVNATADCSTAKDEVMKEGLIRQLVSSLANKSDHFVALSMALVKNLSNSKIHRDALVLDGIVPPLIRFMRPINIPGNPTYSDEVLANCSSVVWSMSRDAIIKSQLLDDGAVPAAAHLLKMGKSDRVTTKACGALMCLAVDRQEVKTELGGMLVIPLFARLVASSTNQSLVRNALGCLYMLSSDAVNLQTMLELKVGDAIQRAQRIKDKFIQAFCRELHLKIDSAKHAAADIM